MKKAGLAIVVALVIAIPMVFFVLQADLFERPSIQQTGREELFPGERELHAKAGQEGGLVVYTVWDTEDIVAILKEFSKRYPDIKGIYWQARNPEIVARVLSEFQAGQKSVDSILADSSPPAVRAAGAIMPYQTVQKDFLLANDPTMPVVSMQIQVLAYNTKLLTSEELPKTWEDAANPKYGGEVALDDPMRGGPLSQMLAAFKDYWQNDTRWSNFVIGLKSLNVPVYESTGEMFRLLAAGEYSIGIPALLHDVLDEKQKGAPVDFITTAPPIIAMRYAAIYAKAPHPNSAKLFAEWLISPDGQAVLDAVGRETARRGFHSRLSVESVFPNSTGVVLLSNQEYLANPKAWLDKYVKPIWEGSTASSSDFSSIPITFLAVSEETRSPRE
jgi:iron(III) transport system substrate-binding protein